MAVTVRNDKELGKALKNSENQIIIEGDLSKKVIRIKATGTVAWAIAIGAIGFAVASVIAAPATGGTSVAVASLTAPAAAATLGVSTTASAIGIAVAAGGVGALNSLRSYKVVEKSDRRVVLKK